MAEMISRVFYSSGLEYRQSTPKTSADYDELAKREGACNDEACASIAFRTSTGEFRELLAEAIEKATEIPWATEEVTLEDGTKETVHVPKTEGGYFSVVAAKLGIKIGSEEWKTRFQPLADEIQTRLSPFDPSARERKSGVKAVRKAAQLAAKQIFLLGQGAAVAAALATQLGHPVDSTESAVAAAMDELERRPKAA